MQTHRELYPEQYEHALVGKRVEVAKVADVTGTVERVVSTRFGQLAILAEFGPEQAWLVNDCQEVPTP